MRDGDLTLVYATFPDIGVAETIGASLVRQNLVACVNILPGMISIYRWEGAIERDAEVSMLAKTRADLVEAVTAAIVAEHPYETPAVVAVPVSGGSGPFLDWIRAETGSADE
ncbi:divalent-cation tolerance protein CutA [Amorphus sp. MBR-141]